METLIPRDGFDLAADLVLPSAAPTGGVVMLGGSGASDRLNGGYFEPIRAGLVAHGLAVLSYDKRGVGASGGAWVDATLSGLADDAVAAVGVLRAAVPSGVPLAIYGHSEGGWLAIIAAARHPGLVDRIVTVSCPSVAPGVQDRYAIAGVVAGAPDADEVLAGYDRVFAADDYATAAETLAGVPTLAGLVGHLSEPEWRFLCRKQHYDPLPDALAVECPWLALYGSADRLVPVAESMAAFGARADVRVFPGANHRLQIGEELAPGCLEAIGAWLAG